MLLGVSILLVGGGDPLLGWLIFIHSFVYSFFLLSFFFHPALHMDFCLYNCICIFYFKNFSSNPKYYTILAIITHYKLHDLLYSNWRSYIQH